MFNIPCCRTIKVYRSRFYRSFWNDESFSPNNSRWTRTKHQPSLSGRNSEPEPAHCHWRESTWSSALTNDVAGFTRVSARSFVTSSPVQRSGITRREPPRAFDIRETPTLSSRDCHVDVIRQKARDSDGDRREMRVSNIYLGYIFANILLRACHVTIEYGEQRHGSRAIHVDVVMDFTDSIFGTWSIDYLLNLCDLCAAHK